MAAQGLHGEQGGAAAVWRRGMTHLLLAPPAPAAQGLHGEQGLQAAKAGLGTARPSGAVAPIATPAKASARRLV